MAENPTEENTTKSVENEMAESLSATSANDGAISSDKENNEQTDIDEPSTSKEAPDATTEKENIEDIELLDSEKQQDASKTDCNGDLKEETGLDKTSESETNLPESKECNSDELYSTEGKSGEDDKFFTTTVKSSPNEMESGKDDKIYTTAIQSNLNEIMKVVHEDLAMEVLQTVGESATVKNSDKENDEEEQQTVKKKEDVSEDDTAGSAKKCTNSPDAKSKRDSRGSSDKTEEKSNFGIVHSPTAIGELIEEQLASNSALSADRTDHIVEWVKNSVVNVNEEDNIVEECKISEMYKGSTTHEAEKRKLLSVTPPFISPRKSQKIVSNIIKKSIKW